MYGTITAKYCIILPKSNVVRGIGMHISVCDDDKEMAVYIANLVKKSAPEYNIEIFTSGEELLACDTKTDIAFLI